MYAVAMVLCCCFASMTIACTLLQVVIKLKALTDQVLPCTADVLQTQRGNVSYEQQHIADAKQILPVTPQWGLRCYARQPRQP
jgi:hypothetical protein